MSAGSGGPEGLSRGRGTSSWAALLSEAVAGDNEAGGEGGTGRTGARWRERPAGLAAPVPGNRGLAASLQGLGQGAGGGGLRRHLLLALGFGACWGDRCSHSLGHGLLSPLVPPTPPVPLQLSEFPAEAPRAPGARPGTVTAGSVRDPPRSAGPGQAEPDPAAGGSPR